MTGFNHAPVSQRVAVIFVSCEIFFLGSDNILIGQGSG